MPLFRKNQKTPPVADAAPEPLTPRAELPDSTNLSGTCTRCGFKSSFAVVSTQGITHSGFAMERDGSRSRIEVERVAVLYCRHCEESLVVLEEQWIGNSRWFEAHAGGSVTWRGIFWWPLPSSKTSDDIPASIRSAYAEASICLAAGCPRAAAVMARRTLEAVCAEQGVKADTLVKSLAALAASGKLVASLAEWSREVRLVGNRGAHFDPMEKVEPKDVAQLLSFLAELLKFLYEIPAELERRRSALP